MYGIIIGWVLSFVALILYLSKINYYYNFIRKVFNFNPGTWNYLVLTRFDPNWLIRLLNGGVILFYCSLLCFAVSFTRSRRSSLHKPVYAFAGLVFVLFVVLYDPSVQDRWQSLPSYSTVFAAADQSLKAMKYIMIAASFGILFNYYANYPKIRFFKNLTLFHLLGLLPVTSLHLLMFSWAPTNLVKPTFLKGYYNYLHPPFGSHPLVLAILPYAIYGALAIMILIVYKSNAIETYHRNRDIRINRSIDTASLGARAFTHAVKNHLIAIRSEAEYLKERHAGDEETEYSIRLMLQSCEEAMGSINNAADKLKHIHLNLQPMSLDVPVRQAMDKLRTRSLAHSLQFENGPSESLAYIDPVHMSEAVYNLLKNAVESLSMRQDGRIAVATGERNGWGLIRISDNGPGIAAEDLDMIFDPFFTTKSSVNNWGIGLSYCHKIVAAHDGKIEVESQPSTGTTFSIYLPLI